MTGRTIANLHAALSWDLDDFDRGTSHIEAGFTKLRTLVAGVGDAFVAQGKRMTLGWTLPSGAFALFTTKMASDAQELQSAFDYSFGKMSERVGQWAEETGDSMGRATSEMKDGALAFNQLFSKAAPTKEAAADLSQEFTELAQNAASFFNTDFETAMGKLRSGLSGEAEPLRDFGVFINEAAVKTKALELGLIKAGEELNEYGKIMARAALISEGLVQVNGDIERTDDELANKWRRLKAELTELAIKIGERLLPYARQLVDWMIELVQWFANLPEPVHNFVIALGVAAAAMGPMILGVSVLAITLLPLFAARFGPVLVALSALLNPIGTAVVFLAKFAAGLGFSMSVLRSFAGMLLRTLGPIGLVMSAILLFKDDIVDAFRSIWREAGINLGPPLQNLFEMLIRISGEVGKALNAIIDSDLGEVIGDIIGLLGDLLSILLQVGGFVVIKAIEGVINVLTALAEYVVGVVTTVRKLFEEDWAGAWDAATSVVGNAITRIAGWIENIFPPLSALLKMIGEVVGTADFLANDSPLGGAVGGAAGVFWDALDEAGGKSASSPDYSAGDYAAAGSGGSKKSGARGGSGPSAEELADRREEIRLVQALAVARAQGDIEGERSLQRQIDLRDRIDRYLQAGLSKQAAATAAEKDLSEMDEARAIARAKTLESHERSIDLQLAELRNDYEAVQTLKDEEFLEKRILFYREQELDIALATQRAGEDLLHLEQARSDVIAARLADQERVRQIELARLRGDDPAQIRAMEEELRRGDRFAELRANGMSDADAMEQATRESMDRSRAYMQGTFRDTFRDGLRAAMDGNLGDFIKNFWKDQMFDVFARVLDRFAVSLFDLLSGSGGGGGFFGSIVSGISTVFGAGTSGATDFGGNTGNAIIGNGFKGPAFDSGGSFRIKGFAGVDKNLLSLNGNPIARVSDGEIMDVRKGDPAAAGRSVVQIQLNDDLLDARIVSGSVEVVRGAAPELVSASVSETLRQTSRPRI